MNTQTILDTFRKLYEGQPSFYTSPGRVNLIGEHTDYNGGFVLPGAIDKGILAAIRPNGKDEIRVFSIDYQAEVSFGMQEEDLPAAGWARYIFGVVREMIKRGVQPGGFDAVFAGDIPLGAGLSSSAALESTFAFALNDLFQLGLDKLELARIGQATEHNYVGVKCGIMDQFASLFGKEGHLIRLDCRSLEYEYVPFDPKGFKVVLIDSMVKHELASSAYNRRRESCERVVAALQKNHPQVHYLRDATPEWLAEVKGVVSSEDFLRAEYVVGEIRRLLDACEALSRGDYGTVGEKMYATHHGMSKQYEVSCEELDFLNDLARDCGVTGSRVMGGGFGGCTINLVKEDLCEAFLDRSVLEFERKFGITPKIYPVIIGAGARRLQD